MHLTLYLKSWEQRWARLPRPWGEAALFLLLLLHLHRAGVRVSQTLSPCSRLQMQANTSSTRDSSIDYINPSRQLTVFALVGFIDFTYFLEGHLK